MSKKIDRSTEEDAQSSEKVPRKRGRGRPKLTEPSERFQLRKEQILLAFNKAFSEHGYHSVSIQDVAHATGIPKANIYYYFPSKAHIFYALMEEKLRKSIAEIETILTIEDPKEVIKMIIRRHVNIAASNDKIMETFALFRPVVEESVAEHVRKVHLIYIDHTTEAIKRGMAAGIVRNDGDPQIVAAAIFGMPYSVYNMISFDETSKEKAIKSFFSVIGF